MAGTKNRRQAHVCMGCGRTTTARSQVCNRCMYRQPPPAEPVRADDEENQDYDFFDEESGPDSLVPRERGVEVARRWDASGRPNQRMYA